MSSEKASSLLARLSTSTMPLPRGAWMARTTTVPGDSLNGRSSDPFAPRPRPTTRIPAADTCGGVVGAGAAAGGRCVARPCRSAAPTRAPMTSMTATQNREVPLETRVRPRDEVITVKPPQVEGMPLLSLGCPMVTPPTFFTPGRYLVICNVRGHFIDGMPAWILSRPTTCAGMDHACIDAVSRRRGLRPPHLLRQRRKPPARARHGAHAGAGGPHRAWRRPAPRDSAAPDGMPSSVDRRRRARARSGGGPAARGRHDNSAGPAARGRNTHLRSPRRHVLRRRGADRRRPVRPRAGIAGDVVSSGAGARLRRPHGDGPRRT